MGAFSAEGLNQDTEKQNREAGRSDVCLGDEVIIFIQKLDPDDSLNDYAYANGYPKNPFRYPFHWPFLLCRFPLAEEIIHGLAIAFKSPPRKNGRVLFRSLQKNAAADDTQSAAALELDVGLEPTTS